MKLSGHKKLELGLLFGAMLYVGSCTTYNYLVNKQAIFSGSPETHKQKSIPVSDSTTMSKTATLALTR
jgi:hypothetical protein